MIPVLSKSEKRHISPIYRPNQRSSAVIIPIAMARRLEIDRPCYVILEEKDNGIFLRKLKIENDYDKQKGIWPRRIAKRLDALGM
jgi:hypothetical protein